MTGAWWDHVDELSHRIGDLLLAYPRDPSDRRRVAALPDRWLRRASVICQLGAGERTDLALLTERDPGEHG